MAINSKPPMTMAGIRSRGSISGTRIAAPHAHRSSLPAAPVLSFNSFAIARSALAIRRRNHPVAGNIGAGVHLPPRRLALFEAVINAVHKAAPYAAIAFNTQPKDTADAAARWLPAGSRAG